MRIALVFSSIFLLTSICANAQRDQNRTDVEHKLEHQNAYKKGHCEVLVNYLDFQISRLLNTEDVALLPAFKVKNKEIANETTRFLLSNSVKTGKKFHEMLSYCDQNYMVKLKKLQLN